MTSNQIEYHAYMRLIDFLQEKSWSIVCASPPAGTNSRFHKCLFPRRDLKGKEKGPRDEVDLIAVKSSVIVLAEIKPLLSDSLSRLNVLSESDYDKLKRIKEFFPPEVLADLLKRGTGLQMPENPVVELALAVRLIDCDRPPDITVIEVADNSISVLPVGSLRSFFS